MTDGVHANLDAIQKMEEACARLARTILEALPEIQKELRQATEALDERAAELRREIASLEEDIASADEDDDKSGDRRRLEDAEEAVASVERRRTRLEEVGAAYTVQARKVEHLSTGHAIKAQDFLDSAAEDLKAYFALSVSDSLSMIEQVAEQNLVPLAIGPLGEWGEVRLENVLRGEGSKPHYPMITSLGPRYHDRVVGTVAHEAKAGLNVKLTSAIKRQIDKDALLVESGDIDNVHWHFFRGADQELLAYLLISQIDFTIH